VDVNIYHHLL